MYLSAKTFIDPVTLPSSSVALSQKKSTSYTQSAFTLAIVFHSVKIGVDQVVPVFPLLGLIAKPLLCAYVFVSAIIASTSACVH